jgi:hypothetical protein
MNVNSDPKSGLPTSPHLDITALNFTIWHETKTFFTAHWRFPLLFTLLVISKPNCVTEETCSRATQILFNSSFIFEQVLGLRKKCTQELETTQIKFIANDMVTEKKSAITTGVDVMLLLRHDTTWDYLVMP